MSHTVHPLGESPRRRRIEPANPTPCSACPWRTENHGKPHPDGWYTARNRDRLWSKLRRGDGMTCHPTDPENPCSTGSAVPEDATTHECAGALILLQRELKKIEAIPGSDLKRYMKENPRGLTRSGIGSLLNQLMFGGLYGHVMPSLDLNAPVSHPPLGAWDPAIANSKLAESGS
jgi:hypothetical protein